MLSRRFEWFALVAALSLGACNGCRDDKPYTPFTVSSGMESPDAAASASVASSAEPDAGSLFQARPAITAPAAATRWTFDGRDLVAPAGRAFERAIAADFDGDGQNEIVAWTVPAPGTANAPAGELWLYPTQKKLTTLPGFVPSGPGCTHTVSLAQTGPKSVTYDVTAKCQSAVLSRSPVRAIEVVQPLADRVLSMGLRVADPGPGETLGISVDSSDQDADGRDDVRVSIRVSKVGSDRPATAELRYLDRAAGVSREVHEPSSSIARAASIEMSRAKRKSASVSVQQGVANVRRLISSLCAEGGVPRVLAEDGSTFRCGDLGTTVDRLLAAEVTSQLTAGDPLAALGALSRDGWYFKKASDKERARLEKLVLKAVVSVESPKLLTPAVHPPPRTKELRFSPLAFEAGGALLVETGAGLSRVSASGEVEAVDPDAGPSSWPLALSRGDGARLSGFVMACDRSEVLLSFVGADSHPPEPTELLSPRPGACKSGPSPTPSFAPLGLKDKGIEAIVMGAHVGPSVSRAEAVLRPRVFGSARSPDGKSFVAPVSLGLAVIGTDKPELWRVGDTKSLADCVIADQARAIACTDGDSVRLWTRP